MQPNQASAAPAEAHYEEEEKPLPPPTAADLETEKPDKPAASLLDQIIAAGIDADERRRIIDLEMESREFFHDQRKAKMYAMSGYFKDVRNVAQAATKITIGKSWGFSEGDSLRYIYFVNGRPAVMEEVLLARIMERGWSFVPHYPGGRAGKNCKGCIVAVFFEKQPYMVPTFGPDGRFTGQTEQLTVSFLEEDALAIKIWENKLQVSLLNKKGPWADGYRSDMYFWRTISRFRKQYCADVLTGAMTREEAENISIDEIGVSDREPTPPPSERGSAIAQQLSDKIADIDLRKTKRETKPSNGETKPADPETKPVNGETKTAPEGTIANPRMNPPLPPAPPDKAIIKKIRDAEVDLTSAVWQPIMDKHFFKNVEDIKTMDEANAVYSDLRTAQQEKSKK